jgi:putative molybdopterin biosynthesis protein
VRQEQFLDVVPPSVARARWHAALRLDPLGAESVPLEAALGRVLAEDVVAPGDVPGFDRANMDGYAVRAEDTFGATERRPAVLPLAGEPVAAGAAPDRELPEGHARAVATGAYVPRGADAVVPVEETDAPAEAPGEEPSVRIVKAVAPGSAVAHAGSDVARGEVVLRRGTWLTARETGTLAACGVATVACVRRPRVAVLSTGDEVVPPGAPLAPGEVHDANATMLAHAAQELGCEAEILGIVPDREDALRSLFDTALPEFDAVLVSGGTSKGPGDLSYRVLAGRAEIVVHGVGLKPGKPLCLAAWERRPVAVLPGFPTSAIFTFHAFVAPVLRRLLGVRGQGAGSVTARLARHMASERGRTEFTLVNLVRGRAGLVAFPLGKGSGSVTTFARADGFFEVPESVEYVEPGEAVEVTLLGRDVAPADVVVVGSHCTGLDVVAGHLADRGLTVKVLAVGSRGGLAAALEGACDAAPIHLFDPATGRYNEPFAGDGLRLVRGWRRLQALAFRPEHAARFADGSVEDAFLRAAGDPRLRLANRNPASGTRALVDDLFDRAGVLARPPGWSATYRSHTAVAAAVAQGRADYGVCLEPVARAAGLRTRPWKEERYDFLVPADRWDAPGAVALRDALGRPEVRGALERAGFAP